MYVTVEDDSALRETLQEELEMKGLTA